VQLQAVAGIAIGLVPLRVAVDVYRNVEVVSPCQEYKNHRHLDLLQMHSSHYHCPRHER
jgi:hypothetical protein